MAIGPAEICTHNFITNTHLFWCPSSSWIPMEIWLSRSADCPSISSPWSCCFIIICNGKEWVGLDGAPQNDSFAHSRPEESQPSHTIPHATKNATHLLISYFPLDEIVLVVAAAVRVAVGAELAVLLVAAVVGGEHHYLGRRGWGSEGRAMGGRRQEGAQGGADRRKRRC